MGLVSRVRFVTRASAVALWTTASAAACGTVLTLDPGATPDAAIADAQSPDGDIRGDADVDADAAAEPCVLCASALDPQPCAIACDTGNILAIATANDVAVWTTGAPSPTLVSLKSGATKTSVSLSSPATHLPAWGGRVLWTDTDGSTVYNSALDTLVKGPSRLVGGKPFGLATRAGTIFVGVDDASTATVMPAMDIDASTYTFTHGTTEPARDLGAYPGASGTTIYATLGPPDRLVEVTGGAALEIASGGEMSFDHLALTNRGLYWSATVDGVSSIYEHFSGAVTEAVQLEGGLTALTADFNALYGIGSIGGQRSVVFRISTVGSVGPPTPLATSKLAPGPIAAASTSSFVFYVLIEPDGRSRVMRVRRA